MYAKDCTSDEFKVFCKLAESLGLNPMLRQIWAIKYGNSPATFLIGRDGLLDVAHRNSNFDGMDSGTTGSIKDDDLEGWCKVFRKDISHPFSVTVDYCEYVAKDRSGKPTRFWAEKPKTMIKKVAEAQALRKAFRVTGVYCEDEIPSGPREIPDTSVPASEVNLNRCASCGNVINPEHIAGILEKTGGVPMCDPCFSNWYRKECKAKGDALGPAHVVAPPAGVIPPKPEQEPTPTQPDTEPEPVTLVMCAECGNGVEPAYVEFSQERAGRALCQKCFEAWVRAPKATPEPKTAPKTKPAAPVTPKTICQGCGKEIAAGTTHCQACVEKEMGHKVPPAEKPVTDGPVCKACGAALTKKEIGFSKLFFGADGPLCSDCTGKLQRGEL
jgi:phage recombination protein Bet